MRDASGALHSLQFIAEDGTKRYLTGGRVAGCYFSIGKPDGRIVIAEGYATGASIHEMTGYAWPWRSTAATCAAWRRRLHGKYPTATLILAPTMTPQRPEIPALTKATEAARAVGGLLAVPDFGADRPDGATDFNDLRSTRGAEAVKRQCIDQAKTPEMMQLN